jgi:hypothetical protein
MAQARKNRGGQDFLPAIAKFRTSKIRNRKIAECVRLWPAIPVYSENVPSGTNRIKLIN